MHEETPKLRPASTNKNLITNKSHTEIKKVNKKLRRGSLPTETDVNSPVIKKLMISAKTVATDDLTSLLQSDLSTKRSLHKKKNNQSEINVQTISSEEENLIRNSTSRRRSGRKYCSLSPPNKLFNKVDLIKNDHLSTSQNLNVSLPNRRSLRMENSHSSLQGNSSFNKSESKPNNQSTIAQSDSPLTKSLHKEQRNSSLKKSDYKENVSQSDFENSPQPRKSLRQQSLFTSSVEKHENEDPLNNTQSETLGTRKSLRQEMQLFDISQAELSMNKSVNLLDISQPELSTSKRSTRKESMSARKSIRKYNVLDITENNSPRRPSMRMSCNPFKISQNMSGVGFLNDGNDLIDWDTPEKSNVAKSESPDHADIDSADVNDLKEENNSSEIADAKKATACKVLNSPLNDLTDVKGVRALMETPGRRPKTPKNDLTDVRGVRQLLDPKEIKSPKNDLTNVAGVKALLKTPGRKGRTPKNDLTNVQGVKRLMNPFREPQSPENDLTEVLGVKKLFRTPKMQNSPLNNLTDIRGVRNLLKTPGQVEKSPKNDLRDVRGIKRLMNPLKDPKSPENDLTEVAGVKSLFRSPKIQNTPKNDLSNVKGVKSLMKTPGRKQKSPENDLRDVRGVKQLMDPKLEKSPENDLSDIRGVKQLFKRNNMPRNDLTDVEDVRHLFVTPEKSLNKSEQIEENKTRRVSSMDDLFNELKYENEPSDSPLSHLRKIPIITYERKAMSLSPVKRDVNNLNLKNRYSDRIVQGPSAHVQKWIEEQTVLSLNRVDDNEIDTHIHTVEASVEPEVFETQSKPINQRVLRTKNLEDIENTSDVELTPRTRTRRQQIKAAEDAKTASPLTQSRRGKIESLSVEGITKIVVEREDVPPKKRGRPKKTKTNVTDTDNVTPIRTRGGRGKDTAEDEVVEQVVLIQKTTRRMRKNERTAIETVEVIQNNAIEDVNILDSLGIIENEKKKTSKKRTKAETDSDAGTIENKSAKRQRKKVEDDELEISRHVKFDVPDFGTPEEPKRTRRGARKIETEAEDIETKPTARRGRNARKKEVDETEHVSEIVEPVPQTTGALTDINLPVKSGRNTRKKEQDGSEDKVEENELKPTQKRGRNTRKKEVKETETVVENDENVQEEKVVKSRRKQPAKNITAETEENDINSANVLVKPTRRTRAAKVTNETEKTEDTEQENTGKKTQRKKRSPNTESTSDEKAEENSHSTSKRTRTNIAKEKEEPVRKSARTRKAK